MTIDMRDYQEDALSRMKTGCILNGGVGSGKSRTSLAYFWTRHGGTLGKDAQLMSNPKDLYIITTARKRDTNEWNSELLVFGMSIYPECNYYKNKIVVDSWNNITKYVGIKDSFFIFDEQRVVGWGAWSKSFIKIAKENEWILLSATPGDKWEDYIPVFIANGFYKNKTEFSREHLVYSSYTNYPKVERYLNTGRLVRLRNNILIDMDFKRETIPHHETVWVNYNQDDYKFTMKERFDLDKNEPLDSASKLCYKLRQIINSDPSRLNAVFDIVADKKKVIIFYNFDYELDILKDTTFLTADGQACDIAEWNGHKHQPIPDSDAWVYLVQYTAGAEGWNCITTDTIIFFSQNYSYKMMLQSAGRIDRLNTPFVDLYYYHLKSKASIDLAISKALSAKKKFNEIKFVQ